MTYNQKRYIELLKRSEDLKNLGKSFYQESKDEYLELSEYEAAIASYLYWKSRTLFVLLMEKFVNKIISGEEFSNSFLELRQRLIYECDGFLKELGSEKLKDFQLDPRSYGFGSLISFLRAECDNFSEDYQNEEFYDSIKDCFLKLQKALNEEWGIISLFLIILFLIFMHIKLTYFSFYLAKVYPSSTYLVSLAAFILASQSIFESYDLYIEISHSFLPTILYF